MPPLCLFGEGCYIVCWVFVVVVVCVVFVVDFFLPYQNLHSAFSGCSEDKRYLFDHSMTKE